MKPVPKTPYLPNAGRAYTILALNAFDQDLNKALFNTFVEFATRLNAVAPLDGSETFALIVFDPTTGAIQSGQSAVNFDQIFHEDGTNTWYMTSDAAGSRETNNTASTLNVGHGRFTNSTDISSGSSTGHAFQTGLDSGPNIAIDTNEIQSRNNGSISNLAINILGGDVDIGLAGDASFLDVIHGHIRFPAAQNPSTDSHCLDDYEKDTWTPVLTFSTPGDVSVTYSRQLGSYQKVGNWVRAKAHIITSAFTWTTASGEFRITGLPFTSANDSMENTGDAEVGSVTTWGVAGYTQINANISSNVSYVRLVGTQAGAARASVQANDMTSGTNVTIIINIEYEAAA